MSAYDRVGQPIHRFCAYMLLPDSVRQGFLDLVLGVLPARVSVLADLTIHLARKG